MLIKDIVDENFSDYKKPSMYIATCFCTFKCCIEQELPVTICQNQPIAQQSNIDISTDAIFRRYISNSISQAIVVAGLEPMLQFEEIYALIGYFRKNNCDDEFIIYTGYYPNEIKNEIEKLKDYNNIIIKYGRYIPNSKSKYDYVLGINLISDNQYAVKIS
jgi:organic radical activating enzyme